MAEAVPHLGLPVRGQFRRRAVGKSKLFTRPEGPIPALSGRIWGVPGADPGGNKYSTRALVGVDSDDSGLWRGGAEDVLYWRLYVS